MAQVTQADIESFFKAYNDPYLQCDLYTAKVLRSIEIQPHSVRIVLVFGYPLGGYKEEFASNLRVGLGALLGSLALELDITTRIDTHVGRPGIKALPHIKNIIAVGSGKGGVGKSTTAVNLAIALAQEGAAVGILDADIYGPSQPTMLGVTDSPELKEKKQLLPIMRHGIQSMSIGYLIDTTAPMIWRGPMVTTALQQLLNDTLWDNLDYLFIDLPPGTGDIQLTMAQKIPVSGAVIVTTPQDLALLDAKRATEMFNKVDIPVLGVFENMSIHICSECGHAESIFGHGGGQELAAQYHVDHLGSLPLDRRIRELTDQGTPIVAIDSQGAYAKIYREAARRMAAKLALQAKDYSLKFPNIVVKND